MRSSLFRLLDIQRRVIGAVMIREIYLRFGRRGIGFLWLAVEPLMFGIPVLFLWSIVRPKYDHGILMTALTLTGYLPILLFRHIGASGIGFVRTSVDLLYHRHVTLFDIFTARVLTEFLGNIMALILSFIFFYYLGDLDFPVNFPLFCAGYLYMFWWSIALALIVASLAERSIVIEKLWPVYSYTYMFFSGFFFLADWLPPKIRDVALLQPSLQSYEMIRGGMFGNMIKTYGDPAYTTFVLAIMTVIGLWLLRDARKHIEVEA